MNTKILHAKKNTENDGVVLANLFSKLNALSSVVLVVGKNALFVVIFNASFQNCLPSRQFYRLTHSEQVTIYKLLLPFFHIPYTFIFKVSA